MRRDVTVREDGNVSRSTQETEELVAARRRRNAAEEPAGSTLELDDETLADLSFGQIVIIAARWILVAAGLLIALWGPVSAGELKVQVTVLLILAVANFYLHAQLLTRRPVLDMVAYGASAADIAIITLLVIAQGGFKSGLYIFYFPAILAFSVAFPTAMTATFAGGAVALYASIAVFSLGLDLTDGSNLQHLVTRLLMLAGVAVCGNMYWRIERKRRREAAQAGQAPLEEAQRTPQQEAAEDIFFGQVVTIWARWFLILAGTIIILWTASTVEEITARVPLVIVLMAMSAALAP